jgi:lipopolysaccharide/colanic/teichoic acid biosynthesis glycosyltransferase
MPLYSVIRRVLDVLVSLILLTLFFPLLLVAGIAIWIADPGKIIFSQLREGKDATPFRMFKFRTMYADADAMLLSYLKLHPERQLEWNTYLRLDNDPRVLPRIGRILRRSSLDELPQLWNILRGDMSLVGPRPFVPSFLNPFDNELRAIRNQVLPGLTGLWQVSGRSELGVESMLRLDAIYVERQSLSLDLWILYKTPSAVLQATGAY